MEWMNWDLHRRPWTQRKSSGIQLSEHPRLSQNHHWNRWGSISHLECRELCWRRIHAHWIPSASVSISDHVSWKERERWDEMGWDEMGWDGMGQRQKFHGIRTVLSRARTEGKKGNIGKERKSRKPFIHQKKDNGNDDDDDDGRRGRGKGKEGLTWSENHDLLSGSGFHPEKIPQLHVCTEWWSRNQGMNERMNE